MQTKKQKLIGAHGHLVQAEMVHRGEAGDKEEVEFSHAEVLEEGMVFRS